jgi:hypothetical protein
MERPLLLYMCNIDFICQGLPTNVELDFKL